MNNHFIKNIEIKNFKCFENFTAEGFGRVNLIGGKNNVGKTAFMEACYVNLNSDEIDTLYTSIIRVSAWRNLGFIGEQLSSLFNDITKIFENIKKFAKMKNLEKLFLEKILHLDVSTNLYHCLYENINNKLYFKNNFDEKKIPLSSIEITDKLKDTIYFNPSSQLFLSERASQRYAKIQKLDKEIVLNTFLNNFDPNIEKLKFINKEFYLKLVGINELRAISEFGDGLQKYTNILLDILTCYNGVIFIDEIENGIHYTQLDELWKIILEVSKEQNVQVFATTHSKECIESYARVAKKLEDEEVTYSVLTRLKSGKLHHSLYDYALLENAVLEQAHEVR